MSKLCPKEYVNSVFDISYEQLYSKNITNLIFDVDNTLVPFDVPHSTDEINKLLKELIEKGFKICLLSNNNKNRIEIFSRSLMEQNIEINAIPKAMKPFSRGIKKALKSLDSLPENTVLIGDQLFTDVLGGNSHKLHTILVKPIANRDEFTVKLKRGIERKILKIVIRKM